MSIREKLFEFLFNIFIRNFPEKHTKCLDVGCGKGLFLEKLFKYGYTNVEGLDGFYAPENKEILFTKNDFSQKIEKQNEQYECVFLLDVIEHVQNQYILLDEIHRILKKDGVLFLTTPNIYSFPGKLYFLFRDRLWGFNEAQVSNKPRLSPGHINPFILNIFLEFYSDKFELIEKYHYGFIIPIIHKFIGIDSKFLSGNLILILRKK